MKDLLGRTIVVGDAVIHTSTKTIQTVRYVGSNYVSFEKHSANASSSYVVVITDQLKKNKLDYPENYV